MKKILISVLVLILFALSIGIVNSEPVKRGDINSDGDINSIDFALYKLYLLGGYQINDITVADLNGDGSANSIDYGYLKLYLLGRISTFPADEISTPTPTIPQTENALLIPHKSWTCGMPEGIPKPEIGKLVFEVDMKLDMVYNLGETPYGKRQVLVVKSGTVEGERIKGTVMSGGLDFQLDISNGVTEVEQILVIKTDDGRYMYIRSAGTGLNQNDLRMVPDIEVPKNGTYGWINNGKYVGRRIVDTVAKTMKIRVYDISGIDVKNYSDNSVTVTKPENIPYQPWDYRKANGERKGNVFITEFVQLGESQSIGENKNGNRNIIPITGGYVTGSINAKILAAGADYQNLSNPMTIDARYLWQTDDGEIIIVRNGGQFGSLVPTFEVRKDSKYSFLNTNLYLSSDPSMGAGGVTITFYESRK
ncbi:DUF3237 family protein [Acetivibrio clariflavus]|uniref:Dockerin-like protein n=1 Tax=Acetivibrio clariflavus (strain DSM 19732 / NBRC 101661 / EBR45) TaxID=720554 RepID=G8LWM5_ACECE|nr:DUF3237 family protein [Acetivibrio clariflavus]AEV68693.1 dockerin-like protein [Acetivibrio clariflavus DSM 19732]